MLLTVYVSIPVRVNATKFKRAIKALVDAGYNVRYWDRISNYNEKDLKTADAVIFYGDSWSWQLPTGCLRERDLANKDCLAMFSLYENSQGEFNLYSLHHESYGSKTMQAVPGTRFIDPEDMRRRLEQYYDVESLEELNKLNDAPTTEVDEDNMLLLLL